MSTRIKNIDVYRAIKTILGINFKHRLLDFAISPSRVEWCYAVQPLQSDNENWYPRVIAYFPPAGKVAVLNKIGDPSPIWIEAQTLIFMAEAKLTSPPPQVPSPPQTFA